MKRGLMRPTAALFPAVLLLTELTGGENMAAYLFLYWLLLHFCSLCSVDAFRNAAAREPGVRRVDRRFSGAWTTIILGAALVLAIMRGYFGVNPFDAQIVALPIAAACIYIEQMFEERMFALSRNTDGVVLSVLSNVMLLAGLMLDSSGGVAAPVPYFFTACGAGLGMAIAIAANYAMEPMRAFSLAPRNIAFFPKAAVQSLLYPAAGLALVAGNMFTEGRIFGDVSGFCFLFCGMMLWRLSRTVCRRANDESRPLNLLILVVCGALAAASLWFEALAPYAAAALLAMVCAIVVFCAPGWRLYAGGVLVIAANVLLMRPLLQGTAHMAAVIACCVAAVGLNVHKAFLRKV